MPALPLSSSELATRLAAAQEAEILALQRLQSLEAAGAAAGVDDSPEEREAAEAHQKAKRTTQRLRVAVEHAQAAERAQRIALIRADQDAEDKAVGAALDDLERCADKMARTLADYAKSWERLIAAQRLAQQRIANHRGGVFRPDLRFIHPERSVKYALAALSSSVPGRVSAPFAANIGAPLAAGGDVGLAEEISSLVEAAREDLACARDSRAPLPHAQLVTEPGAAEWTV